MKGLAINTENLMRFKDFKEPALESLQKEVGGCIEVVHPKGAGGSVYDIGHFVLDLMLAVHPELITKQEDTDAE